jgi:membrane-bound lytic murein transglycosylase D
LNYISHIYRFVLILALVFVNTKNIFANSNVSVWEVLRQEFNLNHEANRPEVRQQITWLKAHPNYIQELAKSEPYIYHIISEIQKRNLPGELALLPMIESAFNPFAYSSAGASGLWQIMPMTGREYGLRQSWWYDSRRSVSQSTNAALRYLTYLNKFFNGNWTLTIAAYDAGEGSVARSVKRVNRNSRNAYFWSLSLPRETRNYIPKLFALAEVIENPQKYNIKLPNIEHRPYFKEVNIGGQLDLDKAAKLAGVSYQSLINLNPEYNRSTTAPGTTHKLLIPVHKVETFKRNLADLPEKNRVTWKIYKVTNGENIQSVATKNNTSPNQIKELNKLPSSSIKNQQFLLVPKKPDIQNIKFSELEKYKVIHIVSKNETLKSIQNKYHVATQDLLRWNERLSTSEDILPGQTIVIWKTNSKTYTIKPGDNLSKIALENNISVRNLIRINPNLNRNKIKPGQTINIRV